jgi:hypothetical protein
MHLRFLISLTILTLLLIATFAALQTAIAQGSDYATLIEIRDSLGNVNANSWSTGTGGNWSCAPNCPDLTLDKGDIITITAQAIDPNNRPLEYKFSVQPPGGCFQVLQDWSSSNTLQWAVDSPYIGPNVIVAISVRNDDGSDYQGSFMGDDYTYAIYDVNNPGVSPATLNEIHDSLGNVNTNSWTKGTGGGWSCAPTCPDLTLEKGKIITITAQASDPNDRPLEYKFSIQPPGGSFQVLQDWSSSNTLQWAVDSPYIGPNVIVAVSVRNDDGSDYQGSFMGDDYTYAIYQVFDPDTMPAYFLEIHDSLGNVNTNSWTNGTGGSWDVHPTLAISDVITFTAVATDPNHLPMTYKFARQNVGGSFETLQDWSPTNTYTWTVSRDDYGANVIVSIHVRNDDGLDWQGSSLGDDYTYATYQVLTVKETITQSGGSLYGPNADGSITLVVLPDTLSQTTTFSYTEDLSVYVISGTLSIIGDAFDLGALLLDGSAVVSFTRPISLIMGCGSSPIIDPETVVLIYYDSVTDEWIVVDSDPVQLGPCQFAATTTHLSRFAFVGSAANRLCLPTVIKK